MDNIPEGQTFLELFQREAAALGGSANRSSGEETDNLAANDGPVLLRHDSEYSVASNYNDGSSNDLSMWQGAFLLAADCMGTGVLALPGDAKTLGWGLGIGFLIANLPINLYAGTILHASATSIETKQKYENRLYQETLSAVASNPALSEIDYRVVNANTVDSEVTTGSLLGDRLSDYRTFNENTYGTAKSNLTGVSIVTGRTNHTQLHHDTSSFDFIGMTRAMFNGKAATRCVMVIYYTNIFLVLGNYILVMSHAVSAAFGGSMCYPTAGLIASVGMFIVSQSRTMAKLGKAASYVSLSALLIVVVQCLWATQQNHDGIEESRRLEPSNDATEFSLLRKLSAFGSIGFAVGSQKLFLNIRHELADRSVAPKSLAAALLGFGFFYVVVILLAGPNPPGFLFDAIPSGWNRQLAGVLLWAHVVVSYAINSQAICSSMDRLLWYRLDLPGFDDPAKRWMSLTFLMALTAYTVANAIPFFKDLVALIGAVTSVPLTLLLPALFWRKYLGVPLVRPTSDSLGSFALVLFSTIFMVSATLGSLSSIRQDWANQKGPFACH